MSKYIERRSWNIVIKRVEAAADPDLVLDLEQRDGVVDLVVVVRVELAVGHAVEGLAHQLTGAVLVVRHEREERPQRRVKVVHDRELRLRRLIRVQLQHVNVTSRSFTSKHAVPDAPSASTCSTLASRQTRLTVYHKMSSTPLITAKTPNRTSVLNSTEIKLGIPLLEQAA